MSQTFTIDDLKSLPIEELIELKSNAETVIESHRKEREREINEKFLTDMQSLCFSVEEAKQKIGSVSIPKNKKPAKYRNPDDENQTWNGFGPTPKWLKDLIDSGRDKEEFTILKEV
jgi:DNA-binding protein H-NS